MIKTTYIYALIDPRTNEVRYIGKANNPEFRLKGHIREACKGYDDYRHKWLRKLIQYNLQPILQIIEECSEDNWQEREKYWIKYYKEQGCKLTNLTDGGEGVVGHKVTEKTRKIMSISRKGRTSGMKGKHHTKDSIQKISENNFMKGKFGKDNPLYGRKRPIESIEKQKKTMTDGRMIGSNNPNYGKKHPELSERFKGENNPNSKKNKERKRKEDKE